jgi:hypothetical protein
MHWRECHVWALFNVRSKKPINDLLHRHFARSNEEKSRTSLLQEQLLKRYQFTEHRPPNFFGKFACECFQSLGNLNESALIHGFAS